MLNDLYEQFSDKEDEERGLFASLEELKQLLYLRRIAVEDWGERPLSKLIHDNDQEITSLYAGIGKGSVLSE